MRVVVLGLMVGSGACRAYAPTDTGTFVPGEVAPACAAWVSCANGQLGASALAVEVAYGAESDCWNTADDSMACAASCSEALWSWIDTHNQVPSTCEPTAFGVAPVDLPALVGDEVVVPLTRVEGTPACGRAPAQLRLALTGEPGALREVVAPTGLGERVEWSCVQDYLDVYCEQRGVERSGEPAEELELDLWVRPDHAEVQVLLRQRRPASQVLRGEAACEVELMGSVAVH